MNIADDSPEYYRMREAREREAAAVAATAEVARIHLDLAAKYQELAQKAESLNDNQINPNELSSPAN